MFDAVETVRSALLADPGVAAIVGDKVRPWPANQTLGAPCVLLSVAYLENRPTMLGETIDRARVQVDCLARTNAERAALRDAARLALSGYAGNGAARILFLSANDRTDDRAGNYGCVMEFDVIEER